MDELVKEIDSWIDQIPSVASDVEYWLIRTQSGKYYDSFKEHNFIAIEHEEISLGLLHTLKTIHGEDSTSFFEALKAKVIELYPDDKSPGLTTNQIIRFVYKLKTNDVIIIPSENSKYLTFGVVTSNTIPELSEHQLNITGCPYRKRKKVKWNKTIKRSDLDPYLFKMLQSHQAISNINNYAELIQRNLRDFYLLNDEINLVLDVNTNDEIQATDLFGFGHSLLTLVDKYAKANDILVDLSSVQVKTYLNSPGKLNLKSYCKRTLTISAVLLFLCGGGYENGTVRLKTDGLPGLIKSISDFLNEQYDREKQDLVLKKTMDSLEISDSKDFINVMKQVSTNKDLPK